MISLQQYANNKKVMQRATLAIQKVTVKSLRYKAQEKKASQTISQEQIRLKQAWTK